MNNHSKKKSQPHLFYNPFRPGQTWTGHGRRPAWYLTACEAGIPASQLRQPPDGRNARDLADGDEDASRQF